jgi:Interferon-induced transmembrane protein
MQRPARDWTPTPSSDSAPHVPNYIVPAILSACCFCGMPFGIVSIIYAAQVNSKAATGDIQGAINASLKAKRWLIIAVLVGLLGGVVSGILQLASGIYSK